MHLHLSIMSSYICIFLSRFHAICVFFFFCLVVFFFFQNEKKKKEKKRKNQKNTKPVYFVYIGTCVPWMAIETKFSKLCISCNLDEYLYAQLSKYAL